MSVPQATKREPISLAIKESIRSFYQTHQKMKVSDMVLWAQEKYEIPFLQATMRTILFPKQKNPPLWTAPHSFLAERKRERSPSWPELELELSNWYRSSIIPPKGQELRGKAVELWRELAPKHYVGQKQPSFGDSWRDKFKARHGFKLGLESIQENNMENKATATVRATITDYSQEVHDEVAVNCVIRYPNNILADFRQLETVSKPHPLIPERRMPLYETTLSCGRDEISPSFNSQYMWSQLQAAADGVNPSDVTARVATSKVTGIPRSGDHGKQGCWVSGAARNQIKRRKINNAVLPGSHSIPLLYELDHSVDVSECILNLSRMASNGQEYVSSHLVKCIVNSLFSEVRASKPFNLRKYWPPSPHLKILRHRIDPNKTASIEALRLLQSAEIFRINQPEHKEWSEWESEMLFNTFVCFPPRDCDPEDSEKNATSFWNNFDANAINSAASFQHNQTQTPILKKRRDTIFSVRSKRGRIDIRVSKASAVRQPDLSDCTAEVIFTPTRAAQLRFFLQQHVTQKSSTLLTPALSIRNTIPNDSDVFKIAAFGTVDKLREIFSSRKASPSDCDTNGRSLINYALSDNNVETVNFLLDFEKDIDRYETDRFGNFSPLVASTVAYYLLMSEYNCERRTQCFKSMLDKGVDPTLQVLAESGTQTSVLHLEILLGSKRTFEAIMNSGYPLINPNFFDGVSDLLSILGDFFQYGGSKTTEIAHKFTLLLKRGANIKSRDEFGWNSLHRILCIDNLSENTINRNHVYSHDNLQHILMALITAGADVKAIGDGGMTPSDIACRFGHEEVWIQALAECGYDPWQVFTLENESLRDYFPGMGIFLAAALSVRHTKLSFLEFSEQLEALKDPGILDIDRNSWIYVPAEFIRCVNGSETDSDCWSDGISNFESADWDDGQESNGDGYCYEPDYSPINSDPTWLAYIPYHQFLSYWVYENESHRDSESVYSSEGEYEWEEDNKDEYSCDGEIDDDRSE